MNICVFGDGVMGNIVRQMLLEGEDCVVEPGFSAAGPVAEQADAEAHSTASEPSAAGKEASGPAAEQADAEAYSTACEPAAAGKEASEPAAEQADAEAYSTACEPAAAGKETSGSAAEQAEAEAYSTASGPAAEQADAEAYSTTCEPAAAGKEANGPVEEQADAEAYSTASEPAAAGKETSEPAAAGKETSGLAAEQAEAETYSTASEPATAGKEAPGPAAPKIEGMIDFSYPGNIQNIYESARRLYEEGTAVPVVIATTGYNDEQMAIIKKIAEFSPVMLSSNFSYGINCMAGLVEHAMAITGEDTDVEIIEKHHNRKTDVPSGTALMLAKLTGRAILCGRSTPGRRGREVGVHSVRGGNIFGEHTIIFAMDDEVIEIKHTAYSRRIFAKGAIEAVHWLEGKPAGMYNVLDCLTGLC